MRECIRRGLYGALLAGGLAAFGAGAACASDQAPTNEDGLLSGNGLGVSVEIPVSVDGNAVSVVGDSVSTGTPANGDTTGGYAAESVASTGDVQGQLGTVGGIVTDNTTDATVTAPINVGGNAVSGIGDSTAGAAANSAAVGGYAAESAPANSGVAYGSGQALLGTGGIATGNATDTTVTAPVNVDGNAVSVIGDSNATAAPVEGGPVSGYSAESDAAVGDIQGLGTSGIVSGNTTDATVTAPVNVDGNAVSVIGDSATGPGTATNSDHEEADVDGAKEDEPEGDEADHEEADAIHGDNNGLLNTGDGIITGNTTDATVTAPVNVDGNAVSVIGDSATGPGTATNSDHEEADVDGAKEDEPEGDEADHEEADAIHGDNNGLLNTGDGIITGNTTDATVTAPVNVDGNAVSVIGDSATGPATATNGDHEEADVDGAKDEETEADEADHDGTEGLHGDNDGLLGNGDGLLATGGGIITGTATDGDHDGTEGDSKEDGAGAGDAVNTGSDEAIDTGNASHGGASDQPGNAAVGHQDDIVGATGIEDEVVDSGNAAQGEVNVELEGGVVDGNHGDELVAAGQGGTEAEGDGFVATAGFSGGAGSNGSGAARDSAGIGTTSLSSGSTGSEFEVINLSSAAEATPLADTGADTTWALMMGALLLLTGVASFRVRRVLIMSKVD